MARAVKRHQPAVEAALQQQQAHVVAAGEDISQLRWAIDSLPEQELRRSILEMLRDGVDLGVEDALSRLSFAINGNLANAQAQQWAETYTFGLVNGINDTSRQALQRALAEWVQTDQPLRALHEQWAPLFGEARAKLIATTEITRAYAEGSFATYERAGFNQRPEPERRPPAHAGCRCWVSLKSFEDGWHYVWLTNNDSLVCKICGPRHLMKIGFAGAR